MTATRALTNGLRAAWSRPRLVLGLYLASLLWTLAVTWPCYVLAAGATATRPYAAVLGRGLHLDVLAEVLARRPGLGTAAQAALGVGVLGWLVIGWFLTAGVLGALRAPAGSLTLRGFAAEAAGGGFAMARLQLLSLVPFLAAGSLLAGGGALAGLVAWRTTPNGQVIAGAALLGAVPGLLLWLVTITALDLARARATLGPAPPMWRVLLGAFRLVATRPRPPLGLQVGGGLLFWGLTGAYLAVAWPWTFAGTAAFALLTLLRQLLVLGRTGVRVAVLGGSLELVRALAPIAPRPQPEPAAALEEPGAAEPRPVG